MLSVINKAYISLAYAIIDQCEKDKKRGAIIKKNCKGDYISSQIYESAEKFNETELYNVLYSMIDIYNEEIVKKYEAYKNIKGD